MSEPSHNYFVMTCEGVYPTAVISAGPALHQAPWMHGQVIDSKLPLPLTYVLDPQRPGNLPALIEGTPYPLMRDDLVHALQAAGVHNLQLFPAVVKDPANGTEQTNYKAFNIIGLVRAADLGKSKLMGTSDSSIIDVDFDSLSLDERKAAPFDLFRLAESVSAIIVSRRVKEEIERHSIEGMLFYEPENWSG